MLRVQIVIGSFCARNLQALKSARSDQNSIFKRRQRQDIPLRRTLRVGYGKSSSIISSGLYRRVEDTALRRLVIAAASSPSSQSVGGPQPNNALKGGAAATPARDCGGCNFSGLALCSFLDTNANPYGSDHKRITDTKQYYTSTVAA